jgi:exodeoxyribonuclease VII small subunit
MATQQFDYQKARNELQELIDWFESGSADIDEALKKYKRAEALITQLEAYLHDVDAKLQVSIHSAEK